MKNSPMFFLGDNTHTHIEGDIWGISTKKSCIFWIGHIFWPPDFLYEISMDQDNLWLQDNKEPVVSKDQLVVV